VAHGGGLAGGEQLLIGVQPSGKTPHDSVNQMHGKVEERTVNSPRRFTATGIDRGRRAASNGGRRSSAHDDEAKLVKQIEKQEEE
jgi:hypothetical protein